MPRASLCFGASDSMPSASRQWHVRAFLVTCVVAAITATVAWTVGEPWASATGSSGARHPGIVLTDVRPHELRAWVVAVQQEGKIVAAGGGQADVAVVRYERDGRLDTGFGDRGKVLVPVRSAGMHAAPGTASSLCGSVPLCSSQM